MSIGCQQYIRIMPKMKRNDQLRDNIHNYLSSHIDFSQGYDSSRMMPLLIVFRNQGRPKDEFPQVDKFLREEGDAKDRDIYLLTLLLKPRGQKPSFVPKESAHKFKLLEEIHVSPDQPLVSSKSSVIEELKSSFIKCYGFKPRHEITAAPHSGPTHNSRSSRSNVQHPGTTKVPDETGFSVPNRVPDDARAGHGSQKAMKSSTVDDLYDGAKNEEEREIKTTVEKLEDAFNRMKQHPPKEMKAVEKKFGTGTETGTGTGHILEIIERSISEVKALRIEETLQGAEEKRRHIISRLPGSTDLERTYSLTRGSLKFILHAVMYPSQEEIMVGKLGMMKTRHELHISEGPCSEREQRVAGAYGIDELNLSFIKQRFLNEFDMVPGICPKDIGKKIEEECQLQSGDVLNIIKCIAHPERPIRKLLRRWKKKVLG